MELQVQDEEASSSEMTITSDSTVTGSGSPVQEKLRELLALRVEIDLDIEALKRAVNILEGSSP